jgi:hypothetical protein
MILMLGGGLAVGSTVTAILLIHGLNTGNGIVKTVAILLALNVLGVIAGAFTIQFERAKIPSAGN